MNVQIFGSAKSFDTKKAERWFKERRIKYQFIDMKRFGLSGKEFDSVLRAVGGVDRLVDWEGKRPELDLLRYLGSESARSSSVCRWSGTGKKLPWAMPRKPGNNGRTKDEKPR